MNNYGIILALATMALFVVTAVILAFVWIWRKRYTRERFAFAALAMIGSLTLAMVAAVWGHTMPWHIVTVLTEWLTGKTVEPSPPGVADYGFLICLLLICAWVIRGIFEGWDGKVSERQYLLEQERTRASFAEEGIREIIRLIKGEEPSSPQQRENTGVVAALDIAQERTPWRERARELFRLRYPAVAIDVSTDWHEEACCWIGKNTRDGSCVALICENYSPSRTKLAKAIAYASAIAERLSVELKVIVALEHEACGELEITGGSFDVLSENDMLSGLVDLDEYLSDLIRRVEQQKLPDSGLTLSQVCVSASIASVYPKSGQAKDFEIYIEEWLVDDSQRQLALLGDYGQGKSTATLLFVYRRLKMLGDGRIPILIELRGSSPRNLSPLELLGAWGARYNISAKALMQLHTAGRLLIIFEGFDEMSLIGDAEMRLEHFKTLWQFCSLKSKILITGRPNFFFDEEELIASLGISDPIAGKPYCEALRLEPFDVDQMRLALRQHDEATREQICAFATENAEFRELVSRPSLLHIVSVLWRQEKLAQKLGTLSSAYVMRLFVQHSYRRQGLKEDASPGFMALTSSEREYFMKGIATVMAAKRLQNQIGGSQLKETIDTLIDAMPESVSMASSALSGEVREPLSNRIASSDFGRDHVHTDVRTCGLLVDDPAVPGCFRFGHKSFMEYLFAETLHGSVAEDNSHVGRSLLNAGNARAADIAYLPVSITFLSELLAEQSRSSRDNEVEVASKLLEIMSGPGRLNYYLVKSMFPAMILASSILGYSRFVLWSSLGLSVVISLVVTLGRVSGTNPEGIPNAIIWSFPIAVLCTFVQVRFALGLRDLRNRSGVRDVVFSILVWDEVCRKLGIHDDVKHHVAGIGWVPWRKGKPFDYFVHMMPKGAPFKRSGD